MYTRLFQSLDNTASGIKWKKFRKDVSHNKIWGVWSCPESEFTSVTDTFTLDKFADKLKVHHHYFCFDKEERDCDV